VKKVLGIGAAVLVVILGLGIFNYFYYFPPKLPEDKIIELAEKQLEKDLPSYIRKYSDPYMKTTLHKIKILDVRELGQKTYLVFKADVQMPEANPGYQAPFQAGTYMLGIRLVEGKPGGIVLKDGMEFTTEMISGANPAECGLMPDGLFYGFCKDPRVDRVVLEMNEGLKIEAKMQKRVILAQIPKDQIELTPRFYDKAGTEIEQTWGMKIAFVSQNEKYYRQYNNYPLEWWNMSAEEIDILSPGMVNAVWVFPDQQKKSLEKERAKKLLELVKSGIPVVFVGMKDLQQLEVFSIEPNNIMNAEVPASEVEAVYLAQNEQKTLQAGVITLDEEQDSPVLMKTLNLRYQLDLPAKTRNKTGDAVKEKAETAAPRTVAPAVKATVTGGGRN
jgi:hypothetical protein